LPIGGYGHDRLAGQTGNQTGSQTGKGMARRHGAANLARRLSHGRAPPLHSSSPGYRLSSRAWLLRLAANISPINFDGGVFLQLHQVWSFQWQL